MKVDGTSGNGKATAVGCVDESALRLTQFTVDQAADCILWADASGDIVYVNESACRRYGYSREELVGLNIGVIAPSLSGPAWHSRWQTIKGTGASTVEIIHRTKEGELFPVEVTAKYVAYGGVEYDIAFIRDITERTRAEETLRLTQLSVDRAADLIHWIAPDGSLLYVSDSTCLRHGYSRDEMLRMTVFDLDPAMSPPAWKKHWAEIKARGSLLMESVHKTKSGEVFPVELTINYVESAGKQYNFAFGRDISERKRHEEELLRAKEEAEAASQELEQAVQRANLLNQRLRETQRRLEVQARTDPLTGAMNRRAIVERLEQELARTERRGSSFGIGMIDIDHFKDVNDAFGHVTGDEVLRQFVSRSLAALRPYDSLGRFGGEEFLVIAPESDQTATHKVLERVRAAISASPIEVDGQEIRVTVSIGGAICRGDSSDAVLRAADDALYDAKCQGRDLVVMAGGSAAFAGGATRNEPAFSTATRPVRP